MNERQILEGIPKIICNAEAIFYDAKLLMENCRYERAYSLFQLAIEEIAKAFMLMGALLFEDLSSVEVQNRLKKDIKNHESKSRKSIGLESIFCEFLKKNDLEKYEELSLKLYKEYDSVKENNEMKNAGFYTTFDGSSFQAPCELINKESVNKIKIRAGFRIHLGKMIIPPLSQQYDLIRKKVIELNFDKNEMNRDQVEEIIRIKKKYNYP